MSNNQDIDKKQFYSKLKTAKKIKSRLINREDLRRFLLNCEDKRTAKFRKVLKKELEKIILKLLAWEQIIMLCVHSWHHLQSMAREIQVGRSLFLSELYT